MLLAIDIGNTHSVFAVFDGKDMVGTWRMSTDDRRTFDEYAVLLLPMLDSKSVDVKDVDAVIISSVVPHVLYPLKELSREYFSTEALVLGESKLDLPVTVSLPNPEEVGEDRLVNAVAAFEKYKQGIIIIDFGTATTFDVVRDDGHYIGGVITPGINLSLEALRNAAAKLPDISIKQPKQVLGISTITAMQSGVFWGYISMLEGVVDRLLDELEGDYITIATGGLAPLFFDSTETIEYLEPNLTLEGLWSIYNRNQ